MVGSVAPVAWWLKIVQDVWVIFEGIMISCLLQFLFSLNQLQLETGTECLQSLHLQ
jgi:hypothetical protein